MRIAVVCSDLGVRLPGAKGASLHLEAISRAFQEVGHEVLVVGVQGHGTPPAGLPTHLLPHPGRTSGLRREVRKIRFTATLARDAGVRLASFRPDVVYERLALFGTAGSRLARALDVPHVLEINALLSEEEARWRGLWLGGLARRRERTVLDGAQLRLPVSDEVAAEVERVSSGGVTRVVPNGLDDGLFRIRPARELARLSFGISGNRPVLTFVGALRPWHGVDVALRALRLVPDALLAVAGDGPVREDLERLAGQLGVAGRVTWLGHVAHREMPRLLAATDVALAPYPDLPGFGFSPLKLYEYLGAGVPVVASDIGQVRTALEAGRWGTLVAPGSPEALAAGIHAVLADPGGSRARADAARVMALRDHTWRSRASLVTGLIAELGVPRAVAA